MIPEVKYYECHITVDPVFGTELELFKSICANFDFKVAKLLMEKGPSTKDSFCTGHDIDYDRLFSRMRDLRFALENIGFTVRRNKIEAVIFDERYT